MSSMYSSYNNAPRCQRCGASLALNNPRCTNCGYVNTAQPVSNASQQQSPAKPWNQSAPPGQYGQIPSSDQTESRQSGGLLKRYSAQSEQSSSSTSQTFFSAEPQSAPRPIPPRVSLNAVPPQNRQQPDMHQLTAQPSQMPSNWSEYSHQSAQLMNNNGYSQNMSQPPVSFRASSQQVPPPAYAQNSSSFYQKPNKRRQFRIGRLLGVLTLLLVIVGGSFLAYTLLFSHKNTQQATKSDAVAHSSSTPDTTTQGSPLFQDEFTNNTHGWSIQSYPGEFSVALGNGALKLENDNNKLLWELIPASKTYGDFQLSVDAVLSKGSQDNGYGVYIRSALSQNSSITTFYRFELYGDVSLAIFKGTTDANGTETTSRIVNYTNSSAIQKQGSLNHITISAKGSNLQFVVNGQTLSTVSDTAYTNGSIALFVSNLQKSPPGAVATFSHLAIYSA